MRVGGIWRRYSIRALSRHEEKVLRCVEGNEESMSTRSMRRVGWRSDTISGVRGLRKRAVSVHRWLAASARGLATQSEAGMKLLRVDRAEIGEWRPAAANQPCEGAAHGLRAKP